MIRPIPSSSRYIVIYPLRRSCPFGPLRPAPAHCGPLRTPGPAFLCLAFVPSAGFNPPFKVSSASTPGSLARLAFAFLSNAAIGTVVSMGKPTSQSAVWDGFASSRAVDGNNNGDLNAGSCTHTDSQANMLSWWSVDLQRTHSIEKVCALPPPCGPAG